MKARGTPGQLLVVVGVLSLLGSYSSIPNSGNRRCPCPSPAFDDIVSSIHSYNYNILDTESPIMRTLLLLKHTSDCLQIMVLH